MRDLFAGPRYLLEGFKLIFKPGLRRFVAIPVTINIVLFAGLTWWAYGWVGDFTNSLLTSLPSWLHWLRHLLMPVFVLTTLVIVFFGFSIMANLIAAPFNGLLAEAVECYLTGSKLEGDWKQVMKDILPSIMSELRKLLYFVLRAVPLLLLLLIPGINVIASLLWLMFSAWMLAVQYMDFPMANHHLFFKQQRARLRKRPILAWSFGGLGLLMTMTPILNFLVMPVSVAGATVMWVREEKLRQER